MSTDRETTLAVRSWLEAGVTRLPDRVLDAVLDQVPATPQRRSMWSAWRFPYMSTYAKLAAAAAAVLVVAVVGSNFLPGSSTGGGSRSTAAPTAQPTTAPTTAPSPAATATTVTITPFDADGFGICPPPELVEVPTDCVEDPRDDSMRFTFTLPEGWELRDNLFVQAVDAPMGDMGGVGVIVTRGSWLYSEPCRPDEVVNPDIKVGPTAEDFVTALDEHPLLDVSPPMIEGIDGYTGTLMQLQVPANISACVHYRPVEQAMYAQGPSHIWKYWILDVEGIRVVVQANYFPTTSSQHLAELQAVVDSIQITP